MMTPKDFLSSYVKGFNAKDASSLIRMYEPDACFVIQPGQVVNGLERYVKVCKVLSI
jgi:ketosteroid isomerase-like protein